MAAKRAFEKAQSPGVFGQVRNYPKMFRAGLYSRVSTNEQQTLPLQNRALREYAAKRGWTIAMQMKEGFRRCASGTAGENCSMPHDGAILMWFWFGAWIAGAGPWRIWFQRYRNWSISASVSYR